ncbi:uncharacterized protein [Choristoneura fumiferana]|uniref:uncharacterized protein n=1 Tax=Choristoneura fumiferana TaxID=7141 RepID=UPI003D154C64
MGTGSKTQALLQLLALGSRHVSLSTGRLSRMPLTSLPGPDLAHTTITRLDRFRQLEQMRQHFWKRWQAEYVTELQQRLKWRTRSRDLQQGDLVIIKEDNQPPLLWRLGRVDTLHPGSDGVPRVADITTARGVIRRALNRLCLLHDS